MKHIRTNRGIFLFPKDIAHVSFTRWTFGEESVLSAGFIGVNNKGEFYCYGESETLKKSSLPDDTEILQKQFK